jgi:hypothetical protein
MNIKHPIVLSCVLLWVILAIRPQLLFGQAGFGKQDPTKLRITFIFLGIAHFAFWYFMPGWF